MKAQEWFKEISEKKADIQKLKDEFYKINANAPSLIIKELKNYKSSHLKVYANDDGGVLFHFNNANEMSFKQAYELGEFLVSTFKSDEVRDDEKES